MKRNRNTHEYWLCQSNQVITAFNEWKISYLECKKVWIKFCEKAGATAFHSKSFKAPKRFRFIHPVKGWSLVPDMNYYYDINKSNPLYEEFQKLPQPDHFDNICETNYLPLTYISNGNAIYFVSQTNMTYYPMWTRNSPIIIKSPLLTYYSKYPDNGIDMDTIYSNYKIISTQTVNYLMAEDELIRSGGNPDEQLFT